MSVQRFNPGHDEHGNLRMQLHGGGQYMEYSVFQLLESKHYAVVDSLSASLSSLQAKHDRLVAAAKRVKAQKSVPPFGAEAIEEKHASWVALDKALADEVIDERGQEGDDHG